MAEAQDAAINARNMQLLHDRRNPVQLEITQELPKDCPCPPIFKEQAYCPDCPYREVK